MNVKRCISTILMLSLIMNVEDWQYISLRPEDKDYLLKQLPRNHKLSNAMKRFINQSYFQIPDERTKRQYMMYQPEPNAVAAPPAYQLNLPIITQTNPPTSYLLLAPPIMQQPDLSYLSQGQPRSAYPQWPKELVTALYTYSTSTTQKLNLQEFVENTVIEAGNLQNGIHIPTNLPMEPNALAFYGINRFLTLTTRTSTDTYNVLHRNIDENDIGWRRTQIGVRQVESGTLEMPGTTTTSQTTAIVPLPTTCETQKAFEKSSTGIVTDEGFHPKNITEVGHFMELNSNLDKDIQELIKPTLEADSLSAFNKTECEKLKQATSNPKNDSQKADSQIKEKLMNILESVESIKPKKHGAKEGLPCPFIGKWMSTLAGSGFVVEQNAGFNFNVPLFPGTSEGFLKTGDWNVTASTPITGLLILRATRSSDYNMATFTGECRTCNEEEIVTGHWLLVKPASNCEEMNRGQDFFGDTWKRAPEKDAGHR